VCHFEGIEKTATDVTNSKAGAEFQGGVIGGGEKKGVVWK